MVRQLRIGHRSLCSYHSPTSCDTRGLY